jgi:hypothetical protein
MVPGSAPSANVPSAFAANAADTAICGRRNHKRGAWQRSLMIDLDFYCICRNCLRVKAARQKKEQQHAHGS